VLKKSKKEGLKIGDIASLSHVSKYGVTVLLEAGLSLDMVMVEDDRYLLTKTGFFVLSDPLTKVNMNFTNDINYLGAFYLKDALKSGKPVGLHKVFGKWNTIYEALAHLPQHERSSWFEFDHYYSNIAFDEVLPIVFANKPLKIIDLGGNTGKFAMACANYADDVRIAILDLPGQLDAAKQNITDKGYKDRIDMVPIDFLDKNESFPKGFDIIWMSQFLDCFSEEEIVAILQRAKVGMNSETELFIMETFWDDQKYPASTYSLHATSLYFTSMANGNSRMYHSDDMRKLVEKAGLFVEKEFSNIGVSHTLFKCKRK
ncbi:MAG: SAM-dependent methyltransferase, partial [Bacteroidales bacterium]|nr:SAM-dependent methyltransferase [Bacteroidales bacterium]